MNTPNPPLLRAISLGAGVQSTTMALMAKHGEATPLPDCAIFADTGAEPRKVYDHLDWLEKQLPFQVHRVSAGDLRKDILAGTNSTGGGYASAPIFLDMGNRISMGRRQCTREYKITPIAKKQRELLGLKPRQRAKPGSAEVWIGISMDEIMRMKPARDAWQTNRWPLIEKQMTRQDCLKWLSDRGYPQPPKSACTFCPFHNDDMWRDLRDKDRESWDDAVNVDRQLRENRVKLGWKGIPYLHRSCKPLDQVDLRTDLEVGQPDLFNNECEGMCGV